MGFLKPDQPELPALPSVADLTAAQEEANRFTQFSPYGNMLFGSVDDDGAFNQAATDNAIFIQETPFQSIRREGEEALSQQLIGQAANQFGNIYGPDSTVPNIDRATLPAAQFGVDFNAVPAQQTTISGAPDVTAQINTASLPGRVTTIDATPSYAGQVQNFVAPQSAIDQTGLADRQSSVDVSPSYTSSLNTSDLSALPTDFASFRTGIEQDVFNRELGLLNPEMSRQTETLRQNLQNRGIPIGSAAYNDAVDRLERSQGEQLGRLAQQARITGGQEASRQFGMQSTARGQQFGERQAQAGLANQVGQQQLADAFSRANLANQQRQADFGERAAAAQFGLNAQQQNFGQQAQQAALQNQTQAQILNDAFTRAALANQQRQSAFGEQAAGAQFQNAAQGQAFGQAAQNLALANAGRQQGIADQLLAADQANRARQQELAERQNLRGQSLAEFSALLGGPGYQAGAFQAPAPANVLGAQSLANQQALAGFNAQQNQANAGLSGLFGLGAAGLTGGLPLLRT
tara:strand:+ start:858 stop:2417 length:1560 start_codon:yes stop_codon:yes gene_type:complete